MSSTPKKTAVVKIQAFNDPDGEFRYTLDWGHESHPNNYTTSISGYTHVNYVELYAAREAIKTAKKQKYTGIRIMTGNLYVWDLVRNSANFVNAPSEVVQMVQAIQAHKEAMKIKIEYIRGLSGNGIEQEEHVGK